MKAQCYATKHHSDCPADDCGCGIYGQFRISQTFESVVNSFPYFLLTEPIYTLPFIVLTEHYGRIKLHEFGLRSEYAKVVGAISFREDLVTFDRYREMAKRAADILRVPMFGTEVSQSMIDNSLAVNGI